MAKIAITTDAGAVLAFAPIPDTALTWFKTIYGGATNQQTAALVLVDLVPNFKEMLQRKRQAMLAAAGWAALAAAEVTAVNEVITQFPE